MTHASTHGDVGARASIRLGARKKKPLHRHLRRRTVSHFIIPLLACTGTSPVEHAPALVDCPHESLKEKAIWLFFFRFFFMALEIVVNEVHSEIRKTKFG